MLPYPRRNSAANRPPRQPPGWTAALWPAFPIGQFNIRRHSGASRNPAVARPVLDCGSGIFGIMAPGPHPPQRRPSTRIRPSARIPQCPANARHPPGASSAE